VEKLHLSPYIMFGIMEIFNCDKYAMCQCQIGMICHVLAIVPLDLGLWIMFRVRHRVCIQFLWVGV